MSPSFAGRLLRIAGLLLILLGIVHLAATPHIPVLVETIPSGAARERATGATLLNHVLVGFLLLPFGYTTWLAAAAENLGSCWARRTLLMNALTLTTLPLAIGVFMRRPEYYRSPLFVAGAGLTGIVSVLVLFAAIAIARGGAATGR